MVPKMQQNKRNKAGDALYDLLTCPHL